MMEKLFFLPNYLFEFFFKYGNTRFANEKQILMEHRMYIN